MNDIAPNTNHKRNRKALFALFFIVNGLAALGGGLILFLYYYKKPESVEPTWRLGQSIMFYGIINLGIIIALFTQSKKEVF
ncbi:hypothetical protein ACFLS1_04615 [Verrucomicrobiota bacterium]